MSYCIETAARPHLSMLGSEDPKSVKILEAFHKMLGRPESFLTFGPDSKPDFSLLVKKGQTIKEALTAADYFGLPHQDASARHHVPKLLAQL